MENYLTNVAINAINGADIHESIFVDIELI